MQSEEACPLVELPVSADKSLVHAMVNTDVNAGSLCQLPLLVPVLSLAITSICLHAESLPADVGGCTHKASGPRCRGISFTQAI